MWMCDKFILYTALFSCVIMNVRVVHAGTFEESQGLYNYLEQKIDIRLRPLLNQSDVLIVNVFPTIVSLQGLDEKSEQLQTTLALQLRWNSETLQWLPSLFGGTAVVHISPNNIWTPDLAYQNAVGNTHALERTETMKVMVAANGNTVWATGSNLDTVCRVDITRYPFDTQTCTIILGKLYSFDYEIMLIPSINKVDFTVYEENDKWIIRDTNVRYRKITDNMNFIEVEFVLQRRYLYYLLNTMVPVILVSLLNVFSFRLPIQSGERMSYCISLFLTFMVLLETISDSMPQVSKDVSYLQLYINIQLILGMVITTISILLVQITQGESIPKWIVTLSNIKCINNRQKVEPLKNSEAESAETYDYESAETDDEVQTNDELSENRNDSPVQCSATDSIAAVKFIDKICFWVFLALFVMSTLICILLLTV